MSALFFCIVSGAGESSQDGGCGFSDGTVQDHSNVESTQDGYIITSYRTCELQLDYDLRLVGLPPQAWVENRPIVSFSIVIFSTGPMADRGRYTFSLLDSAGTVLESEGDSPTAALYDIADGTYTGSIRGYAACSAGCTARVLIAGTDNEHWADYFGLAFHSPKIRVELTPKDSVHHLPVTIERLSTRLQCSPTPARCAAA